MVLKWFLFFLFFFFKYFEQVIFEKYDVYKLQMNGTSPQKMTNNVMLRLTALELTHAHL